MRRILITRRTVPLDRSDEYLAAWQQLAAAAALRAGHAWLFRRSGHEDRFVEFLEWVGPAALPEQPEIADALRELDEIAAGTLEELEEAR
jgi:hypothetical protein